MPSRSLLIALLLPLIGCGSGRSAVADDAESFDTRGEAVETELRRFPGVEVRERSDGIEVRVRGTSSFLGEQEPLYVVDGNRIEAGPGGALIGVRRADIVDIRVLKSAAETSSYGPRGANGVILITTRSATN